MNSFKKTILLLHDDVHHKWPKEWGEAFDVFLRNFGWHIRVWMLPSDLIPFIKQGDDAVDKYFIKKLRWATFRLRWQSIKRFPHRKK